MPFMADWGHMSWLQKVQNSGICHSQYRNTAQTLTRHRRSCTVVPLAAFPACEATGYIHNRFLIFPPKHESSPPRLCSHYCSHYSFAKEWPCPSPLFTESPKPSSRFMLNVTFSGRIPMNMPDIISLSLHFNAYEAVSPHLYNWHCHNTIW